MGRLTKEMKKAELMEQLTEANEAYAKFSILINILMIIVWLHAENAKLLLMACILIITPQMHIMQLMLSLFTLF